MTIQLKPFLIISFILIPAFFLSIFLLLNKENVGIEKEYLKEVTLSISMLKTEEQEQKLVTLLKLAKGIQRPVISESKMHVHIQYDSSKLSKKEIILLLKREGFKEHSETSSIQLMNYNINYKK